MRVIFFLILFICAGTLTIAQEVQQKVPDKTRLLFLLDASGSMLASWKNEYRIDAAKRILSNLVDSLRNNDNLELGLRVYGHRYFRKSQNCQDTRLEVPFNANNHDKIIDKLSTIKPKGTTPIAYSLLEAANDFPSTRGYRNIIVLITDGIESCDGDPCEVSLALQRKGIFLKPFVIGIGGLSRDLDRQFECIGRYYNAADEVKFRNALSEAIETSLATTTATIELQDKRGTNRYSNVNVTFENDFTRTPAFDFIHYLNPSRRPDTVEVDPVLSYNIIVNTLPPVVLRKPDIRSGRHNNIEIKTPQGTLVVNQKNSRSYAVPIQALIKKQNGELFHIQEINTSQKYLEGIYDVTVTTLPKKNFRVKIEENETFRLNIPDPGIINLNNGSEGYGSVYEILMDGSQNWVGEITPSKNKTTWTLQPGEYKVVFRSKNAKGSKYTSIKYFTVNSGASISLQLL